MERTSGTPQALQSEKVGGFPRPSLTTASERPGRTKAETIEALAKPIDRRHLKQRKQGSVMLDYFPWAVLVRCLHARCDDWRWELLEVKTLGDFCVVSGRLTIHCVDGDLTYEAVSSEPMATKGAPPVETAASSAIRRAVALAGLGLNLWM